MRYKNIYEAYIKPNYICFDIGANSGSHAAMMAPLCKEVYCFEPLVRLYNLILDRKIPNARAFLTAVSDTYDMVDFWAGATPEEEGASTIIPELGTERRIKNIVHSKIASITLDGFCEDFNVVPDFIKMDTEGAETRIIHGGINMISSRKPTILFEYGFGDDPGFMPKSVDILSELGYSFYFATNGRINHRDASDTTYMVPTTKEEILGHEEILCDLLAEC